MVWIGHITDIKFEDAGGDEITFATHTGSSVDLLVASLRRLDARLNRQPLTTALRYRVSHHNALRVSASMAWHECGVTNVSLSVRL